jgi:transporter family protein
MWILLAFSSAIMLGFYDIAKKFALKRCHSFVVLAISNLIGACIFAPFIISSLFGLGWFDGTMFEIERGTLRDHLLLIAKSSLVLSSWICSYSGLRRTPISLYGTINASRPVFVLLGAILIFGERLNWMQWIGVIIPIISLYLLGRTSKKVEGIDFKCDKGIWLVLCGTILGAASGLYDRYLLRQMDSVFAQSWFSLYCAAIMNIVLLVSLVIERIKGGSIFKGDKILTGFRWSWAIILIAIFLSIADFAYFYSLTFENSMISVVSMIRRGSVLVSFTSAAIVFNEKNLKAKAFDLFLILVGMLFLMFGSEA